MAQPMTYVVTFDVKPGEDARFREALDPVLDEMSREDTFVSGSLARDVSNPSRYVLHETWSDHDDVMTVQLARPYRDAMNATLADVLVAPQTVSVLEPLWADPNTTVE